MERIFKWILVAIAVNFTVITISSTVLAVGAVYQCLRYCQ